MVLTGFRFQVPSFSGTLAINLLLALKLINEKGVYII